MKDSSRNYTADRDTALLQYLYDILAGQSRSGIKAYLTRGQVTVNGQSTTAFDHPVHKGDRIAILDRGTMVKKRGGEKETRVKIVFEDEWLIVVDKRSGVLSMSTGAEGEVTAYSLISDYLKRMHGRNAKVFIVHRLDRETSGLIIFAKDERTKQKLQENWREEVLERKYCAILEGRLPQQHGSVRSWLKENPKSLKVTSSPEDNGGKEAITHYEAISSGRRFSLAEFELETGRKHQIRVHASLLGCPVTGDRRYGAKENPLGRIALHARSIAFRHPVTGRILSFDTGVPGAFKAVIKDDSREETPSATKRNAGKEIPGEGRSKRL